MRHMTIAGLLVACGCIPMQAWADGANQQINLTASVEKFCKFTGNPSFSGTENVSVGSSSAAASTVAITAPTNSVGKMQAAGFSIAVPATCNFPSQVSFTTLNGGMTESVPSSDPGGAFLHRIDYSVVLVGWDSSGRAKLDTNGTKNASATTLSAVAHTGSLTASVDFPTTGTNSSKPLAAGAYTDTLRISLTPQ